MNPKNGITFSFDYYQALINDGALSTQPDNGPGEILGNYNISIDANTLTLKVKLSN